mgnify:CR=1 FL=1
MSQPLALTRTDGEGALLSVLKGLEIQKTLGTEPVLTALRHFPAQPAQVVAPLPPHHQDAKTNQQSYLQQRGQHLTQDRP